jgi:hypothetical protein
LTFALDRKSPTGSHSFNGFGLLLHDRQRLWVGVR